MIDERNQKKGRAHIIYINSVACNIHKHTNYNKKWKDCIFEAMEVHRNYLIFMEGHDQWKKIQQCSQL